NEATIEKTSKSRMVDVVLGVDARPVSAFGCDGVILATPTGSTAYSFSAGGPIVWPGVGALIRAPISAHALFAAPPVVDPNRRLSRLRRRQPGRPHGVDGLVLPRRRTHRLARGRSAHPRPDLGPRPVRRTARGQPELPPRRGDLTGQPGLLRRAVVRWPPRP